MDRSFREQGSNTQNASTGFWAGLKNLVGLISWLASFSRLMEEEREEAGIYLDRLGGE
jgi:hypothetical protein